MRFSEMKFEGLSSVTFKLLNASNKDPYVIKDVKGLGPTEIDVAISRPIRAKSWHQNTFVANRQLVVRVGLNPNYSADKNHVTVDSLRENLYWMVEGEKAEGVTITLVDSFGDVCNVQGYLSGFEPSIFAKLPEIQLTFDCVGDTLSAVNAVELETSSNTVALMPNGTARTPVVVDIRVPYLMSSLSLERRYRYRQSSAKESLQLAGFDYNVGDLLIIGSDNGDRTVTLWRNGLSYDHITYLQPNSTWPKLDPWDVNYLTAWESLFIEGAVPITRVKYTPQYRGV